MWANSLLKVSISSSVYQDTNYTHFIGSSGLNEAVPIHSKSLPNISQRYGNELNVMNPKQKRSCFFENAHRF